MAEKRRLNFEKIKPKMSGDTISTKESLKDVTSMKWSEEVLSGKKEVLIKNK